MARKSSPIRILLDPKRILLVIALGLGAASWMLYSSWDGEQLSNMTWTGEVALWLGLALVMMAIRDLAYMFRIRVLTGGELTWRKAFDVIFLWEFASAITPSVVGGTPIAVFLVNKEGYSIGKASTLVMVTALLDEVFFVTMVPLVYFLIGESNLFVTSPEGFSMFGLDAAIGVVFWVSYSIILFYSIFLSYGLFFNPNGIKSILVGIFRLPFLRRWKSGAQRVGEEIIGASTELKTKPKSYWFKALGATYFSWTARYLVVNFLILAVAAGALDHFLIYGRQLIMWVIMLISPTPGGSGLAELAFSRYLNEFILPGFDGVLALVWRLISYFPYIFIGVIILPRWIQRVYLKRKLIRFKTPK